MKIKRLVFISILVLGLLLPLSASASEKWLGTDDLVDRKMKEISGVKARPPLIDISQGNIGLFIFTLGGFSAGTLFGYQWRKIFSEKAGSKND